MARKACFTILWALTLASCQESGRGSLLDARPKEKLSIVEPLNQSPYTVEIGGEITIKCVATGFTTEAVYHVYWEKLTSQGMKPITSLYTTSPEDSDTYEVNQGSTMENDIIDWYSLTIKDIAYEDEGGYNCYTFYGGKKIESTLLLKVDGPPIVKLFENFISVQEGQDVNISCHYIAKPKPMNTSYWSVNGFLIPSHSNKYWTSIRSIPGVMLGYGEFRLQISYAEYSDAGNYTCVIENVFGQAYATVRLQVTQTSVNPSTTDPPNNLFITKIIPASHTLTSDLSTELKIVCSAQGFTYPPKMKWLFFGISHSYLALNEVEELMLSDTTIKTFSTQNHTGYFYTLYIDKLQFNNSGTYVCKINDTTISVDYLNLTVTGTPIVESTNFVLNGTLGQTVTMTCHVWSNPLPFSTLWYLENQILSTTSRFITTIIDVNPIQQDAVLTIKSVTAADFGVYACRAYNSKGYAMAIHILQDVDECSFDPPCNQDCMNTLGSFKCVCNTGYAFANGSNTICKDINECAQVDICHQKCTNTNGSYFCSCKDGYWMDKNNNCINDMDTTTQKTNTQGPNGKVQNEVEISTETLYTVIGVCAGGLLAIVLMILTAIYCRGRNSKELDVGNYKAVFSTNAAYEPSIEKEMSNLKSDLATIKNEDLKDEFPRQRLQLGIDLGQGRFGKVMMARALNISGSANWEMVAVKTCRDSASDCEKEDLIQELDIQRKLPPHKNIVAYLGCCTKQDPVYILMEYVKGGNLQSYLRKCRPSQQATTSEEITPPSAKDLKLIALQIARGMSHIHTCGIIHRDLSARNILITNDLTCKICDFGLSRDVEGCDVYERSSKGPLPIRWMAPESLTDQWFTKKSDVWSYGVLLWEIVTLGATPYPGMSVREVITDVTMGKWLQKPLHCKQELYLMMTRCWGLEAATRPSFKEIVCDVESLLSQEAEYIELVMYQEDKYNVLENNSDERV